MSLPLWVVDAFVGELNGRTLRGNPAAVVVLDSPRDDAWLQAVAAEMNLSETAFLWREDARYRLRWFTPQTEVKLCGHATLASAHVLWHEQSETQEELVFQTLSGALTASLNPETGEIGLDFPSQEVKTVAAPAELVHALGFAPHGDPIAAYRAEDDWLLSVPRGRIETLRPNFSLLREVSQWLKLRGIIVTAKSGPGDEYDFISRFFAPGVGIDEDPVTGSAHTKLAPFWGKLLKKQALLGYQASPRGGLIRVHWEGNRVLLGGRAQCTVRGQLLL